MLLFQGASGATGLWVDHHRTAKLRIGRGLDVVLPDAMQLLDAGGNRSFAGKLFGDRDSLHERDSG